MTWKPITSDSTPRNGTAIQVRDGYWPVAFWAKYWTPASLIEWGGGEHGWYEYFPDADEDGDELVHPIEWFDPSDE